jgi:hypothetical protein
MKGATANVRQLLQNHGIQPCQCLLWVWGRNHGIHGWYAARVLLAACVAHPTQQAEQAEQANTTAATPHKTSCQAVRSDSVCNTPGTVFSNHKAESAIFESKSGNKLFVTDGPCA